MSALPSASEAGASTTPNLLPPPQVPASRNWRIAWIVLVVGLMITAAATLYMKAGVEKIAEAEFTSLCKEIQNSITERLDDHARLLQSGVALFKASEVVTREEWRIFTQHQNVEKRLPGIQGIGFSLLIPREELARHIQKIRREGFPDYNLRPAGDREVYSSIIYLEPFSGRNLRAFGYDMFSEPVRRAAMERARDTDAAALSGKVVLVQEAGKDVQAGTLMYVPVYRKGMPIETVQQRRAAIYGWVYSPYRMNDLMQGILGGHNLEQEKQLHLQIFDGDKPSPQSLLYSDIPANLSPERFTRKIPVDFNGQRWTLRFGQTGGGFSTVPYIRVWLTMVGGILVTFLLFTIIRALLDTRANAQRMAEKMTAELQETNQSYRNQFARNSSVMLLIDPTNGAIIDANVAATNFYGYHREQLQNLRITDINTLPAAEVLKAMASVTQDGNRFNFQHRRADGAVRDVEVSSSRIQFGERTVLHTIVQDITMRRQAEEARQESEGRLAQLAEQSATIAWEVDAQGLFTYISPVSETVLGFRPDELIGRMHFYDLHPASEREAFKQGAMAVFAQKESFQNLINAIQTKDGRVVWVSTNGIPLLNADGSLRGYRGSDTDITSQKQAEDALQNMTDRVTLAARAGGVGIWDYDTVNNVLVWDDQMFALYGITREQFSGAYEAWRAGLHPEDQARGDAEIQLALAGEKEFDTEFRVLWPDGSIRNIRALALVQRDASGRPLRMIGTNWDITVQKQTEAELRESEIRMRSITDAAQDAILMMDPAGRVSYWNPAAERILGYTRAEAIGQDLHLFLVPPRYHEAHQAAFPVFQQTGQGAAVGKTLDLEARRKNGKEISVQLSLSAIQINSDWHAVGLLRDITVQKQAEAELLETNRNLEAATARANDMAVKAEMASSAKSEFLANMSHEIRTPMNGVIGMTGLLLDTELTDEQRHYAETVRGSGEALLSLINDILDFSKIEAGKLTLETLDFDLASLLDDFAATLAMRAHEKGLELICAADVEVPVLLQGDPGRLRQILTNLTGNSIKFTSAGEVAIRVSLMEQNESDVLLRFSVHDTGIGIPADKIGLLFGKFSQVDASTTRQYGGTGLGLAISKQLAELMGGEIGVASKDGQGSEFWFTVRLGKQAEGEQVESLPPADLHGVRALIVDDNATNREILTTRLASWGMRPSEAQDGPEALKVLYKAHEENDPFQIAVIDMQMPGMDGETLGRTIKSDQHLADTRMVMLTSLGTRGDARRFDEIGFAAYMTKPIQHRELKGVLSLALAERDGTAPTPRPIATRHTARETLNLFAGSKTRILLAEDNITNQQVALGILKNMGLRAEAVANGAEAVRALATIPYDLVLMDVQMPEMDGIEATRRIRLPQSAALNQQVPIIAMTALAMQGDRERCLAVGMNDYVSKPISPQALAEALDKWLPKDAVAPGQAVGAGKKGQPPAKAYGDSDRRGSGKVERRAPAAGVEPESLVFDKAGMMARLMDDEELAQIVIASFIDDIPRQIEVLRVYLASGDAPGAERQAHTIKGASANVGGDRLRDVAFAMEKAGKTGDLVTVKASMTDLEAQFDALKEAMRKEVSLCEF